MEMRRWDGGRLGMRRSEGINFRSDGGRLGMRSIDLIGLVVFVFGSASNSTASSLSMLLWRRCGVEDVTGLDDDRLGMWRSATIS